MFSTEVPASKIFLNIALFFIFGILSSPFRWGFLFFFLIFIWVEDLKISFLVGAVFLFGYLYPSWTEPEFILPLYEGREVTIEGVVVEEDRNVVRIDNFKDRIDEKVIIFDHGSLNYGDLVTLTGRPEAFDDQFEDYFRTDNISVAFFNPRVEIRGEQKTPKAQLFSLRRKLKMKINKGVASEKASILRALLLGDRTSISDQRRDRFSKVGVAHLLAVSGTHIVIISALVFSLLTLIGVTGKIFFTLTTIFLFIILVGTPASAIRAGLMSSSLLIGKRVGRSGSPLRVLIFIAAGMLLFNPGLLFADIGFQLSFLAVAGIIIFSPKILSRLKVGKDNFNSNGSLIKKLYRFGVQSFSITISAQILTIPLIYYYFDNLPLIAPISNLFIAPLLPIIMIFGFLGLILSFVIPEFIAFSLASGGVDLVLFLVDLFYWLIFLC